MWESQVRVHMSDAIAPLLVGGIDRAASELVKSILSFVNVHDNTLEWSLEW